MASGDHAICKTDRSPSDGNPDETLKRRKRHHHHRHHHGHRDRIKHDREKRAEEGSSPVEGSCPNLDEEKEEGEILDEETVERRDNVRAQRGKDDSDVESGEIKGDDLAVSQLEDCCPTIMNNFNGTTFKLGVEKDVELNELGSPAGVSRGRVRSKGPDSGDSRWARSKSPASNEIFDSPKRSRNVVEMRPATFRSKRHRERSSSPRRSKSRPLSGTRSPSTSVRNPDELLVRSRSRSPNRNRSPKRLYHECSDDSRYNTRKDYDSTRSGRHAADAYFDRRERLKDMESDRIKRQGRERSSSYNRHGSRERHESRDVEFGSDQGRYTDKIDRSSSRTLRDDRENERRQNKYGSRGLENGRDVEKDRRRDRPKDKEKGSFVDREQQRDRDKTRRSPSYGDQEDGRTSQGHRSKRSKNIERGFNGHDEMQYKFRVEDMMEDYEERVASKLAEQEEDDIEKIKERSRKMTQAILEKHKKQQQQQPQSERQTEVTSSHLNNDKTVPDDFPTNNAQKDSHSPFRADVDVLSGIISQGLETKHDSSDVYVANLLFSVAKSPVHNGNTVSEEIPTADGLSDGTPKFERSIDMDMFCDDIFGGTPAVRKQGKGDGLLVERSGLHDNWDDAEGYYCFRFGEVLDGQFEINALHGKGVFSAVVRAKDLKAVKDDPPEVAIKIIRNNETMYKAGCGELIILKKLAGADPEDRRHCVRFFSSFKYHNHLCLVFESLHMNLREVLRKFGRNIGLKLTAVRAYAKQLFIALKHLKNCGVLHCDIKPDNMLVNEAKNVLKLCDFGNAMFAGKNEITPYLVSRFYRAPEIILGLTYDHPMDMWSVGCCLYELYTGKVLFRGATNNEMLRFHMELKGLFPKKMLRKGAFTDQHFDQDFNFYATEEDPVTKKKVKRLLINMKPKDMGSLISSSPGEDSKMVSNFKDLLDRIFVLDPDKRLTVTQALSHPFITAPRWRCLDEAAILLSSLSVEFYLFRL